ncbi:MAG: hypothetical protein QFX34_00735 [Candidatus Verstraetearchaeota archaeon]|nr:hypothetical protein [Candidatus Verstraetearchaeota archaeon]
MIIGTLFVIFPWTIPIAVLYLIAKSGIFRKVLRRLHGLWREGRIFDRISDWKARSCKLLKKESFALDYYLPSSASPYAILTKGTGFVCLSSFSIKDRSRSPEAYKRAVGEVLKALGGGDRTISFVVVVTDDGDFLNSMQIASKHGPSIKKEFERAGIEHMELLNIARTVITSTSPTASVEIHRGKDIILKPVVIP